MANRRLIKGSSLKNLSKKEKRAIFKYLDSEYRALISENKKLIRIYKHMEQTLPCYNPYYPFILSDIQRAENVRSQAEKRLEQQRKDLTSNWKG